VGAYWGFLRSINQRGMPGVTPVPIYNFCDKMETLVQNAAVAQAHYTHVFNDGHGLSVGLGAAIADVP